MEGDQQRVVCKTKAATPKGAPEKDPLLTKHQVSKAFDDVFFFLRFQLEEMFVFATSQEDEVCVEIYKVIENLELAKTNIKIKLEKLLRGGNQQAILSDTIEGFAVPNSLVIQVLDSVFLDFVNNICGSANESSSKKTKVVEIHLNVVLELLEQTEKDFATKLKLTPINLLTEDCLRHFFDSMSIGKAIQCRQVCSQWKTLADDKCRKMKSLKIFFKNPASKYHYCTSLFKHHLPQPDDDSLHFCPQNRQNDLIEIKVLFNALHNQQVAQLFPSVETFVLYGLEQFEYFGRCPGTNLLEKLSHNWSTTLTTLVLNVQPGGQVWWNVLSAFRALRRLYLLPTHTLLLTLVLKEEDQIVVHDSMQTVLGRLECFTVNCCHHSLVPLLSSANLKQLRIDNLIAAKGEYKYTTMRYSNTSSRQTVIDRFTFICTQLPLLTYLHVPNIYYPPVDAFLLLKKLTNLRELSFNRAFRRLPTVAETQLYSLELKSVTKMNIYQFTESINAANITALLPALQLIVVYMPCLRHYDFDIDLQEIYELGMSNLKEDPEEQITPETYQEFCNQFAGTGIKVEQCTAKIKHMIGPKWKKYNKFIN